MFFGKALVALVLLFIGQTTVLAQCVFNDTHCACTTVASTGLCTRYSSGTPTAGTCLVDNCQSNSLTCDCNGPDLCEITDCDAWKATNPASVVNVGDLVPCTFSAAGARCLSVPGTSPSPSPTSSPAAAASPSPSPSSSSSSSMYCPGGSTTLDTVSLFPNIPPTFGVPQITTYDASRSFSARQLVVNGCDADQIKVWSGATDSLQVPVNIASAVSEPVGGWPGHCILSGSTWDSFTAVIFESTGFTFQPTNIDLWDLDNQGSCNEGAAMFGMRNGNLVVPTTSTPGTLLDLKDYTVSAAGMTAMGFTLGDTTVPGAQMLSSAAASTCQTSAPTPCTVSFSFAEPIDTLVVVLGMAVFQLPNTCGGSILIRNPTLTCP